MPRDHYKSDRHAALDAVYRGKRYCACKQGRAADCRCAYREDPPRLGTWLAFVFAVVAVVSYFCIT